MDVTSHLYAALNARGSGSGALSHNHILPLLISVNKALVLLVMPYVRDVLYVIISSGA